MVNSDHCLNTILQKQILLLKRLYMWGLGMVWIGHDKFISFNITIYDFSETYFIAFEIIKWQKLKKNVFGYIHYMICTKRLYR